MAMNARRGALVASALLTVSLASGVAGAADIEDLRRRAQTLGDRVTELESELARLTARETSLKQRMDHASAAIGVLELEKHELDARYSAARERFVARAVEAYKDGATSDVEMLLGARTVSQLLTLAEAQVRAADKDSLFLEELEAARVDADLKQERIDLGKQEIVEAHVLIDAVVTEAQAKVDERSALLKGIVEEIADLEAQARAAAASASRPTAALLRLLAPSGPAPDIPDGFAGTGVSFQGVASWYGPGFEGNHTASGDVFDSDLYTAASRDLPLGTWLFVTYGGRGVVVLVNDRGPYIDDRVIDLSRAAAEAIGISGLGWIEAELLIKT